MSQDNTVFWLKLGSGLVIAFGLLGIPGSLMPATGVNGLFVDLAFWPLDRSSGSNVPEARLLWAISGGILAGWGLMMWLLASRLYSKEPELVRTIILTSIGTWFVIDSTGSVLAGAPMNVVYNLGFLFLFVVPLWRKKETITA
ncbi:MAG: hypothetical protein AAGA76_02040 [Pseudomonadota bacterium]